MNACHRSARPTMTHDALKLESYLERFGLESFRPGQKDVIRAVLGGEDCLCVMPTGGGKSLCYQLPALALDGLTLVVSPLIALMKDQVDQLKAKHIPVTFINSTLTLAEQTDRLERMAAGEFKLVYVVPERFRSGRFLDAVRQIGLKLLAVDEAHCISEWGHDFRPDYARLGRFRRMLGDPTTIALTATATDQVRRDIVEQLDLRDPRNFITGFARENLFYQVQRPTSEQQKADRLIRFLGQTPGSGIVYASTRKRTEEVAEIVRQQTRRPTAVYHAGLEPAERKATQEAFMRGEHEIVVATNAFGMGIDKADVRFVVHYNLPGTLEAYYQEAGRAGRDGLQSQCLLLYMAADRRIQEYFIESAYPGPEIVEQIYDYLCEIDADPIELTLGEVKDALGLKIGPDGVGNCEQLLEGAGVLERLVASQNMAAVRIDSELPTLVDLLPRQARVQRKVMQAVERLVGDRRNEMVHFQAHDLAADAELDTSSVVNALRELNRLDAVVYVPPFRGRAIRMIESDRPFDQLDIDFESHERRKRAEYEKLRRVISFASSGDCRQKFILRYFGEAEADLCGHCDNCAAAPDAAETTRLEHHPKVVKTVRITLSGVARTEARFPCGKNLVAQMLCGSGNAKIRKLGLDQLSTFGMLRSLNQPEVVSMIDALVAIDCLEQKELEQFRPVVQMTELGWQVMREEVPFESPLDVPPPLLRKIRGDATSAAEKASTIDRDGSSPETDEELLAALRAWRRERGMEAAAPLYTILSNAALEELARFRPSTPEQLLEIKGIGPGKLARFGDSLLEVLAGEDAPTPTEDTEPYEPPPTEDAQPSSFGERPSHYWTWRLLAAGFSCEECCAVRDLRPETVLDHARRAAEEGRDVPLERLLDSRLLAALRRQVDPASPPRIRSLLPHLPEGSRYEEVELYLKCIQAGGEEE